MSKSILISTKKVLGLEQDYTAFDLDVLMHINSVFTTLTQVGIGPVNGFMIEGPDETWEDFLGDDLNLNSVKTFVYLKVRLLFDPPSTSYHITALEKQADELLYRLSIHRENLEWAQPIPNPDIPLPVPTFPTVLDGGAP